MSQLTRDQLLDRVRQSVPETSPAQVQEWRQNGRNPLVIDIREREEWIQGHVPDAWHLSRSFLELQIEQVEPDREAEVVLYCAGGVRSLLAARNLQEMGYEHVYSMIGGFNGWKNAGLPVDVPRYPHRGAAGTLQPPHHPARCGRGRPDSSCWIARCC